MRKWHGWNVILVRGSFHLVESWGYGSSIFLSSVRLPRPIWVRLMSRSTVHSPPCPRESPLPRFIHPPNMPRRVYSRNPKPNQPLHIRTRPSSTLPLYIEQNRKRSTTSHQYSRMGQRARRRAPTIHRDFHIAKSCIYFRTRRAYFQWTWKW
jgi:hypothetical protein